jgi:hypothetical protein
MISHFLLIKARDASQCIHRGAGRQSRNSQMDTATRVEAQDRGRWVLDDDVRTQIQRRANRLVGRCGFVWSDRDEIEQHLALEILQRARAFDPRRATWRGFVTLVLKRAVSNILRGRRAQKRDYRRNSLLNTTDPRLARHLVTNGSDDTDLALDVAACEARLPTELRAISQSLRTQSISEAARSAGLPRSTFCDQVGKVRQIYESAGLRIYAE